MSWERSFTTVGVTLILMGIALIIVPILVKYIPSAEFDRIPWILLYVYRRDGFLFATSPILILISIANFLWRLFHR